MIEIRNIFKELNYETYYSNNKFETLIPENLQRNIGEEESITEKVDPNNNLAYYPEINDLIRLHFLIRKFKCIKVMEFGVGYSTRIFANALKENKLEFINKIKSLRTDGDFKVFSTDSSKKWISKTKKLIPFDELSYTQLGFSKLKTVLINNKITTQYNKLPNIRPDFIYIDGPSQWDGIKGSVNGMDSKNIERMPISSDVILFEYYLTPGTIIYIDGRSNNARFLKNNLQRNWLYKHFEEEDVNIFFLDETPLGKWNKKHLNFIFS